MTKDRKEDLQSIYKESKKKKSKKRKLTSKPSSEKTLRDWFARKGGKGSSSGWVDCNTCRKGKCKPCGRKKGEKRKKYPACRPTPAACKKYKSSKGKSWGKGGKKKRSYEISELLIKIGKAEDLELYKEAKKKRDPKKGTGKKPKGSGRRLYTDENPKDTCKVSFTSVSAIRKTFSSSCFKSKSHARQSQIINLVHQRVRAAYRNAKDPKVKKRLKKAYEYAEKRKERSKKKTERLNKNKRSKK